MLLAALALTQLAIAPGTTSEIQGRTIDAATGEGLGAAVVTLVGNGARRISRSRTDGSYSFAQLDPGDYCLRVERPGYHPASLCVAAPPGRGLRIDIPLSVRPIPLEPILVQEASRPPVRTLPATPEPTSPTRTTRPMLPTTASALTDLVSVAADRGGGADPPGDHRPHALFIWGSGPERGRTLFDGASLHAPLHLGTILPPIDPDLIGRAELQTAGSSTRFDGGTTHIVDYGVRSAGDNRRGWAEIDPLATRAGAESPLGKGAGLLVGGRRINEAVIREMLADPFGYSYADLVARLDGRTPGAGELSATGLRTREVVHIPRDQGRDAAAWENRAASIHWQKRNGRSSGTALSAAFSSGRASLPLLSAPGGHVLARVDRSAATAERGWTLGRADLLTGSQWEHLTFDRRSRADLDPTSPGEPGPVECTPFLPCLRASYTTLSVFSDVAYPLSSHLTATTGVRLSYRPDAGATHVLPRIALRTALDARSSLTLAAGRFSEVVPPNAPAPVASRTPSVSPVQANSEAEVALATRFEIGFIHATNRTQAAANVHLRLHEGGDAFPRRRSPGGELSVAHETEIGTFSFVYSVTENNPLLHSPWRYRHLAATGYAAAHGPWRLNLTSAYGLGMPPTAIVLEQPSVSLTWSPPPGSFGRTNDGLHERSNIRVDAALGGEWTARLLDTEVRLLPYARIINAFSHRESIFYFRESANPGNPQPLARLPALPMIGVRVEF